MFPLVLWIHLALFILSYSLLVLCRSRSLKQSHWFLNSHQFMCQKSGKHTSPGFDPVTPMTPGASSSSILVIVWPKISALITDIEDNSFVSCHETRLLKNKYLYKKLRALQIMKAVEFTFMHYFGINLLIQN